MNKTQAYQALVDSGKYDGVAPQEKWSAYKDAVRVSMGFVRYDIPVYVKGAGAMSVSIDVQNDGLPDEVIYWVGRDPVGVEVKPVSFNDKLKVLIDENITNGVIKAAFSDKTSDSSALMTIVDSNNQVKQALVRVEKDETLSLTIL